MRGQALPGCSAYASVQVFEDQFLRPTCSVNLACHFPRSSGVRLSQPVIGPGDIFPHLVGVLHPEPARAVCAQSPFIDLTRPADSWILHKVRDNPMCPSDPTRKAGTRMPTNEPAISDADYACFVSYAETVARACQG